MMDFVDKNTLYYVFSTIAQTYGAIVGIIGMLIVYRFQLIGQRKYDIIKSLIGRIAKNGESVGVTEALIIDIRDDSDKYLFDHWDYDYLEVAFSADHLDQYNCEKKSTKIAFYDLLRFHIPFILVSIALIFFSKKLVSIWPAVFGVLVVLFIWSADLIFRMINTLIKD